MVSSCKQLKDVFHDKIGGIIDDRNDKDVINVVRDYKRYIISNNYVVPRDNFDWFAETEKYYHSLPLPENMSANREDFEHILNYYFHPEELTRLNNMNYSDLLHYTKWK